MGSAASLSESSETLNGAYFIDRDGDLVAYVLEYLRTGAVEFPDSIQRNNSKLKTKLIDPGIQVTPWQGHFSLHPFSIQHRAAMDSTRATTMEELMRCMEKRLNPVLGASSSLLNSCSRLCLVV